MSDIQDIRVENLNRLIGEKGSIAKFAREHGLDASYLSQIKNRHRSLGEKAARNLEQQIGLNSGELDAGYGAIDHSQASFPQLVAWENLSAWCKDPKYDSHETIYCPFPSGPCAIVAAVTGEAMAPKYEDGEYVCFDPDVVAEDGDDVLVKTADGKILFRRLQKTSEGDHLLALNSKWPNSLIEMPENSTICGVVIGAWESRRITDS